MKKAKSPNKEKFFLSKIYNLPKKIKKKQKTN